MCFAIPHLSRIRDFNSYFLETLPSGILGHQHLGDGDEALLLNEGALDVVGEHVIEERLGGVVGILGAVHVLGRQMGKLLSRTFLLSGSTPPTLMAVNLESSKWEKSM